MQKKKTGNPLKILMVSNGFYPEISPRSLRATELAVEFCRQGHHVVVITKNRNYDYSRFLHENKGLKIKIWSKARFPRVKQAKKIPFSFLSQAIARILQLLFEYPAIEDMFKVRKMLKREESYDMMISFAVPYPVHWGVAWVRTEKHRISKCWVADCGDPYIGDVVDTYKKPFYFGFLEKWFFRKTDYISVPIEGAIEGYYPEFHSKIRVIPQGFNFVHQSDFNHAKKNEFKSFAYAGGFLPGTRDPRPFLEFLSKSKSNFRFYIFTNTPNMVNGYKQKLGNRLIISEFIPRNELMKKLEEMDFLINFDNNTTRHSPSKLIDYAIVNKPVMNITKEFDELLASEFLEGNYSNKLQLPDPTPYHIKNVAAKFIALVES